MLDLLPIFIDATKTLRHQMAEWFKAYPSGMPWTVVSDYCIGDNNKKTDSFSFVIIANHDSPNNSWQALAAVPAFQSSTFKRMASSPANAIMAKRSDTRPACELVT